MCGHDHLNQQRDDAAGDNSQQAITTHSLVITCKFDRGFSNRAEFMASAFSASL